MRIRRCCELLSKWGIFDISNNSEINPTFEKLKKKGLSNKGLTQIAQFDMNVERGEAPKIKFIDKAE